MSRNLLLGGLLRQGSGRWSPPSLSALRPLSAAQPQLAGRLGRLLSGPDTAARPLPATPAALRGGQLVLLCRRGLASYPDHIKVPLPALSPTMETGSIVQWVKKEGEELAEGDLLCEIETDKAMMGFETPEEGFLAKILIQEGEKDVPIGKLLCIIVSSADEVAAFADFAPSDSDDASAPGPPPPPKAPSASSPPPPPAPAAISPPTPTKSGDQGRVPPPAGKTASEAAAATGTRVSATPFARKLAAEAGLDLSSVSGSGPGGRILAGDVELAAKAPKAAPSAAASAAAPSGGYTDVELSGMRKTIARRLTESKSTIPHYYLTVEVEMDAVMGVREKLNGLVKDDGYKISVNDFVVKAAALACQRVPAANSAWMDTFIREHHFVDVSVAVSTDAGLITPVIRGAHSKGLAAIAKETRELAGKARDNRLRPEEFTGGTFTVSNLGMFGVKSFSAIVNPPQSCILAVGATDKMVLPDGEGGWREASVMSVTLSCDHRVVDGAVGAQWLQHFKRHLQSPHTMLL